MKLGRQLARLPSLASSAKAATRSGIQHRKLHATSLTSTWLSKMRPDLATLHPLRRIKDDPSAKEEQTQMLQWWKQANTDVIAKRISHSLQKGGTVRLGIVEILLQKAWKPEHIKAALQGLTWVQVRYNKDMDRKTLVLLFKAIIRARAPEFAIQIFTSMNWLRIFPTIKDMNIMLSYFAQESRRLAMKSPSMKEAPQYDTDVVEPAEDAAPKDAEEAAEEPAEENATPVDPEKLLVKQFNQFLEILADSRFQLTLDFDAYTNIMKFWAGRGQTEKASRAWAEMSRLNAAAADSHLETIVLSFLVAGDVKRASEQLQKSPPKPAVKNDDANVYLPRNLRTIKMMLAVAQNNVSDAVAVLKECKNPFSPSYAATHLGSGERFTTVQKAFQTLVEESGSEMPSEFSEYLSKVEAHLQEIAPKPAETAEAKSE